MGSKKIEDISFNIYNSVAEGQGKNGGHYSVLEDRIEDLLYEADKEWEDGAYERRTETQGQIQERGMRKNIQAARKAVLNYIKLFAEKAGGVQPPITQGVLDLAEET